MNDNRFQDIITDVNTAECKLEHIYRTTLLAMDTIEGSPISSNPNYMQVYHLLGVLSESMVNLRASLDEIGQAATLGIRGMA